MKRSRIKPKRDTRRRRESPQWTAEEWAEANTVLARRSGGRCECCGTQLRGSVERHHRQRRQVGGDRLANVLMLRPQCHQHWTEHPEHAKLRGIIVSSYSRDPAAVAVYRVVPRPGWYLLDDEGGVTPIPGEPAPPSPGVGDHQRSQDDTPDTSDRGTSEVGCDQHPRTDRGPDRGATS